MISLSHALIIDDDPIITYLTKRVLEQYNPNVNIGTAQNGHKALTYLKTFGVPDLIIFDLNMPVMDGFEFVKNLFESNISYPCLSAMFTIIKDEDIDELKKLGCTDFIEKPLNREKLISVLDKCFTPA